MKKVLPARLKLAREKAGLTQEQVAEILNISIGTISGYERGYRSPNPEMLTRLANLYKESADWLLGNEIIEPDRLSIVLEEENLSDKELADRIRKKATSYGLTTEELEEFIDKALHAYKIINTDRQKR